jgi:hypothetical protein
MNFFFTLVVSLTIIVVTFGAWLTHIVISIQASAWLFMIVGALIPPVAVVHGWATWLGYSWV